jgi:hypothetical protein
MTRVASVGRSKSLLAAGALGIGLFTLTLVGCPGTLDPSFMMTGAGGSTGGGGTPTGTGGQATGTGGTTAMSCDMVNLITVKYTCTLTGACHDANGAAAGLSMMQADWPKLVGTMPTVKTPAPAFVSICATDATGKTMPYIMKGSATGDGLLLKKLMGPVCAGAAQMPSLNGPIKPADMPCFQQWATMLANM